MTHRITGIILSGGKSARMGRDKAFILFSGKPLIGVMIDNLSAVCVELIIATNKPYLYQEYNVQVSIDIIKDKGPLGGIHAGLIASRNMYNFVCACDMPFINRDLVGYMAENADGYDAVIVEHKQELEPLCAVYSKNCIEHIEKELYRGNLKMTDFLKSIRIKVMKERDISKFDPEGRSFVNVNTKKDYQCILQETLTNRK
ncbi:MAG: molybdenum cofactor guanylyltransferase [Candidatus Omnitrophota bacterium]